MIERFHEHIQNEFPFLKGKRLLLAVSGGIDSMVLVQLCKNIELDIAIAHCNFQLRGAESAADEAFVKQMANETSIPIYIKKFETESYAIENKQSIQLAARYLRYHWFNEVLIDEGFDFIVTAHHLDDQLETFLINFTRGTGIEGLMGIPAINDKVVRPLLAFSRKEIEEYAAENYIKWQEDSSNASDKYVRNKIRHHIVPVFKELNSSFLTSFQSTLQHLKQAQSLVLDASSVVYERVVTEENGVLKIDLTELLLYANYKAYLHQWLQLYGFTAWDDIYNLVTASSGRQVFSENYKILKNRDSLLLSPIVIQSFQEFLIDKNQTIISNPFTMVFSDSSRVESTNKNVIYVDKDSLKFPLKIRKWQEGDYFCPLGMHGNKKKLSKFFKDEKLSLLEKEAVWLLCSDNKIVWIVGKRQDERFKIKESTKNTLKIALQ